MATTPSPDAATPSKQDEWDQTMADVKNLVKALHSLMASTSPANNHEPEQPKAKVRTFRAPEKQWLERFQPQPGIIHETLFEVLIDLFRWDKEGDVTPTLLIAPSFADDLTLLISDRIPTKEKRLRIQALKRTELRLPSGKARLKEYIFEDKLWDLEVCKDEDDSDWLWTPPPGGKFVLARMNEHIDPIRGGDQVVWQQWSNRGPWRNLAVEVNVGSTGPSDFGALCFLQVPIRHSILEFRFLEFVLAQTGFLNYDLPSSSQGLKEQTPHLASVLFFIGTFAGHWSSGTERALFSSRIEYRGLIHWKYAQLHFRSFILVEKLSEKLPSDGLQCLRQQGEIASSALRTVPLLFEERRISIFGALTGFGGYEDHVIERFPSYYRVLILVEDDVDFSFLPILKNECELKWWPGFGGSIPFQTAIFLTVKVWEREWNKVLDQIDDCLRFQLDETLKKEQVVKWMFDLDFERSRLYFTILQTLRIFGECIRTVSMDLRALNSLFSTSAISDRGWAPNPDELRDFEWNWKYIKKHQSDAEERLLRRLSDKTAEVTSLRDGLFNATSLREAGRATTMNRYVIIFTIVTVLYLPPSFTSTVFGMTIFQKDVDQTTREYKITTVVVSLITYFVALISVVAVNWDQIKRKVLLWWNTPRTKVPIDDNSTSVPEVTPLGPTPKSPPSRPEDKEKKAEASNEQVDVESGVNEGAGESSKPKHSWQIWR